eukprot:TRINITY_DN5437_c0_g4_i1.p1 TRINITY_DN5437_c0_g4~~TRINITY_DN5437_c0_g4_i1.p1  ORF type:complete len:177 (+),score=30.54 TRINITY_DN5437_c0_g4_i1:545-1075(+)
MSSAEQKPMTRQKKLKLNEKRLLSLAAPLQDRNPSSGDQASAPCCPDLVLGELAEGLGLHDDGHSGKLALAQNLEVAVVRYVDDRRLSTRSLGLLHGALGQHGPELVEVDDRAVLPVAQQVEAAHTHLSEVPRVELVEEDAVVVLATGVTAAAGMLPVLPDAPVARRDVPPLLAVL